MKTLLTNVLLWGLVAIVFAAIFSFINWDINPKEWHPISRVLYIAGAIVSLANVFDEN